MNNFVENNINNSVYLDDGVTNANIEEHNEGKNKDRQICIVKYARLVMNYYEVDENGNMVFEWYMDMIIKLFDIELDEE